MKKQDLILLASVLILAILCFVIYRNFPRNNGVSVNVTVNGKTTKILPLNKNATFTIKTGGHTNVLQIKDGFASITKADCPDKLCVHQQRISKAGETLICLPHKVVVSITGQNKDSSEKAFDGIVK